MCSGAEDGVLGLTAGNKRSIRRGWFQGSCGKFPGRRDNSTQTATALPKVINKCLTGSFHPKGPSSIFTLCDFSAGLVSTPCSLLHSFGYLPNIYQEYSLCADDGDTMVGLCLLWWHLSWFHTFDCYPQSSSWIHFPFLCHPRSLSPTVPQQPQSLQWLWEVTNDPQISVSKCNFSPSLQSMLPVASWILDMGWSGWREVLSTVCQALC